MEDLFREQPGVTDTEVGYTGGTNAHPSWEFHPGHAEALKVTFDDEQTSISALLDYFFRIHDPTTLNRQGNDVGSGYRSAIFYADEMQRQAAEAAIRRNQIYWDDPIITSLEQLGHFWTAEDFHQDYLRAHPGGYTCHYERARP